MGDRGGSASVQIQRPLFDLPSGPLPAGGALLLFAGLCELALRQKTLSFDLYVRAWLHEFSSPRLTTFFVLTSQAGSWFVLLSIGILLAILFVNRLTEVRTLTITLYGSIILSAVFKLTFHVSRPEPFFGLAIPETHSFPSAHALVSCCFFLLIAGLVTRRMKSRWLRFCVWLLASFLIAIIGTSRVYLGVQYPTSVLAGYAGAIVWMESVNVVVGKMSASSEDTES